MLALVAHDNMKRDLAEWVDWNSRKLSRHHLVCTGTTGKMVEKTLRDHREEHEDETEEKPELKITLLKSGPLGGDQQLVSLIADGKINALIFFWDPMSAQPHDVVVSDVSLPGMSGLDLCRHLLASNPQRWVVLCSGYPLEHGVGTLGPHVRSLLKPFELEELEELLDVIASHLQSASPA